MSRILVISPHPDDEAIGCGGTIGKHIAEGSIVKVIFLTSGEKGGHGTPEQETIRMREQESNDAAEILNINEIEFWREPDGNFQATTQTVQRLFEKILALQPTIVYVPHEQEEHPDHKQAALLVREAVNLLNGTIEKPNILMYEVWTPIQRIDHIEDISPFVDLKRTAIQAYKSQCAVMRFDEAILGLNRYRGEMHSWPGGDYAEIFTMMEF
jgi:N-acetylglucosamine malate deacetylase 1